MKLADITRELELLEIARGDSLQLLANDPELSQPKHAVLKAELDRRFGGSLQLAAVG